MIDLNNLRERKDLREVKYGKKDTLHVQSQKKNLRVKIF